LLPRNIITIDNQTGNLENSMFGHGVCKTTSRATTSPSYGITNPPVESSEVTQTKLIRRQSCTGVVNILNYPGKSLSLSAYVQLEFECRNCLVFTEYTPYNNTLVHPDTALLHLHLRLNSLHYTEGRPFKYPEHDAEYVTELNPEELFLETNVNIVKRLM
jgi:hypothetical protein